MNKNFSKAAILAAILLFFGTVTVIFAQYSTTTTTVYGTGTMPGASYTSGIGQMATHPVQMLNGIPPVGYAGATGTYNPVQATSGKELPVRFLSSMPVDISTSTTAITAAIATTTSMIQSTASDIIDAVATLSLDINILNASMTNQFSVYSASGTSDPTNAFSNMLCLSDNSGIKRWFAALVLGDGVNGNNTAAVAQWLWNGSTYDRVRGNASDGTMVYENLCTQISTITYTVTTNQDITPLTNRKWISIQNQGTGTVTLHVGGTPAVYGSGRLIYSQGSVTYNNIDDGVVFSVISDSGQSNAIYVEQGVK